MSHILAAARRTLFRKHSKQLRAKRIVPAVLYGKKREALSLEVPLNIFTKIWHEVGESTVIDVAIDGGETVKVIIQDVQLDPLTNVVRHIDLHQIDMHEEIETDIPLNFTGESLAVKNLGGVLVRTIDHLEVKALPGDLVHDIPVPLEALETFDDMIRVKDLTVPPKITVMTDPEEVVAKVAAPRSEAELKALEAEVSENVEAVEAVEKKEKEEEGEAEEGTTAPAEKESAEKKPEKKTEKKPEKK